MIILEISMVEMMYLDLELYLWNLSIFEDKFCNMVAGNITIIA